MRKTYRLAFTLFVLCSISNHAFAQGNAFTYHGRLNNNGVPATGAFDVRFSIYDANAAGQLVSGPLTVNAIGVTNGLFLARLDFGSGVFTGPPRWIEVSVRPAGTGNFTTLSPRQEFTSSPYSIRAQTAGSAADVQSGAVVKSLNNLRDNVTIAGAGNVTVTPNGNTLTIASSGGLFSANGTSAYYNGGNVGIGTSTPAERLTIDGVLGYNLGLKLTGNSEGGTGMALENTSPGGHKFALLSGGAADNIGAGGFGIFDDTAGDYRFAISPGGNVGIGTPFPNRKLTVFSSQYGFEHTDGNVRVGSYVSAGGGYLGTVSNHKLHFFVNDGGGSMTIDTSQNVGIGTITPASKLDVNGSVLVRQSLTFDAGGSPALFTGTATTEQNRYLQLLNSSGYPSASGLKAGGILVADSYDYADPGKNNLVVKGTVITGGNAVQAREKGGWVKAMIYVNANGTIARCFNAVGLGSPANCGFTVIHDVVGEYNVLFGFQTTDRFASISTHGRNGTFYYGPNINGLYVYTYDDDGDPVDAAFTLIVY